MSCFPISFLHFNIQCLNPLWSQPFIRFHKLHHLPKPPLLKVNTTCGASNVSFGLPNRNGINAAFLTMAMGAGMTSAITSPLHPEVMQAVRGGDVMMGHDPDCTNWIRAYREPAAEGEGRGGRRAGRAGRRRSA